MVDDVEDMLAIANDNVHSVMFYRANEGRQDYLEARAPSQLKALGIRESARLRYGGGTLTAKLRTKSGQWVVTRQFTIEGDAKSPPWDLPAAPAAAAPTATAPRNGWEMPEWAREMLLPVISAGAAAVAARLLAGPKTDPLVLELLKLSAKTGGAGIDSLELQKTIMAAEERGEKRGELIGELRADRGGGGDGSDSLVGAIREAGPLVSRLLDRHDAEKAALTQTPPAALPSPTATTDPMPLRKSPDIVPAWLKPYVMFKGVLVEAADDGSSATLYADMAINRSKQPALQAMYDHIGSLGADLYAAIPELAATPERKAWTDQFVTDLVEALEELAKPQQDGDATPEVASGD